MGREENFSCSCALFSAIAKSDPRSADSGQRSADKPTAESQPLLHHQPRRAHLFALLHFQQIHASRQSRKLDAVVIGR